MYIINIQFTVTMVLIYKAGMVMNIDKKRLLNGNKCHNGYLTITVRNNSKTISKTYQVHRFVWECFYGLIPDKKVIKVICDLRSEFPI